MCGSMGQVASMRFTSFFERISTMRYPMPHMLLDMTLRPSRPGMRKSMYRAPGCVTLSSVVGVGWMRPSRRCNRSSTTSRARRPSGRVSS